MVEWEGQEYPVVRHPPFGEETYVERELAQTAIHIAQGMKDDDGKRMERSERYARWRYRGFIAGEIGSL